MYTRLYLSLLAAAMLFAAGQSEAAESRLLISETFDNCAFTSGWNDSYVRNEAYTNGAAPFVAMDGHGCVMEQIIPAGTDDYTSAQVGLYGSGTFQRVTGSSEATEFYITWEEYYPTNHNFADGAQKMLRFTREGGPGIMLQNQYNNGNLQISAYDHTGVDVFQNSNRGIPVGRWVSFAVWCKLNTPGQRDGFCRAWMDNEQIIDMSNVSLRGTDTLGWQNMWVGGNHTNQKPTPVTSFRFIDNIRWYNTKGSGSVAPAPGPEPTPVPPGSPQPQPPGRRSGKRAPCDFDGNGQTDFRVVRTSSRSGDAVVYSRTLGGAQWAERLGNTSLDLFLDADVDHDGAADTGLVRAMQKGSVQWTYRHSQSGQTAFWPWGERGDVPLTADIDGDGYSDSTIFRPRDGSWWSVRSSLGVLVLPWGLPGDMPVPEDYDGDGWDDVAVFRPGTGYWAVLRSTRGASAALGDIVWKQWGLPGDHPMPGDYDGDGRADLMVYRPAFGLWFLCSSKTGFNCAQATISQFGLPGDIPVKGDFDGDSVLDAAVWRPSSGTWFFKESNSGQVSSMQWGLPGDRPACTGIKDTMTLLAR